MNHQEKLKRLPELYRHRLQIAFDFSKHDVRNSPAFEAEIKLSEIAAVIWYEIYVRQKTSNPFLAVKQKEEEISRLLQASNGKAPTADELYIALNYVTRLVLVLDADMSRVLPEGYCAFRHKAYFWLRQKFSYAEKKDEEYSLLLRRCLEIIDVSKVIKTSFLLLDFEIDNNLIKKYLNC